MLPSGAEHAASPPSTAANIPAVGVGSEGAPKARALHPDVDAFKVSEVYAHVAASSKAGVRSKPPPQLAWLTIRNEALICVEPK